MFRKFLRFALPSLLAALDKFISKNQPAGSNEPKADGM